MAAKTLYSRSRHPRQIGAGKGLATHTREDPRALLSSSVRTASTPNDQKTRRAQKGVLQNEMKPEGGRPVVPRSDACRDFDVIVIERELRRVVFFAEFVSGKMNCNIGPPL